MALIKKGFHDRPIASKLWAMIIGFVVIVCLLMMLFVASLGLLTGVRAYVRAESLWTNGQKDAAFSLARYVYSGDEAHYQLFRSSLERPLQHHIARTEMLKPWADFEYAVARDALVAGGNAPADAPYLIFAFRYLGQFGKIAEAISIWTAADPYILAMNELGRDLHRAIRTQGISAATREASMDELLRLNEQLTPKEIAFSLAINDASRLISLMIFLVLFGAMLLMLTAAIYFASRITRQLGRAVQNLDTATVAVGEGQLEHRVQVLADDELGRLSRAFNDMVAHRQAAEIWEESRREFMAAVLDNLSDAVVACDASGELSLFNRAAERFHGKSLTAIDRAEWPGYFDLYHSDGKTPLKADEIPLVRAFEQGRVVQQELVIKPRGRPGYLLNVTGQAIVTRDGRKLGAVVAMHDITERKRAERALLARTEQLARSNEELSQFAYVASHDLQEPLRTIASHTQMLVRRLAGRMDPEQLEFTQYIVEAARRMREQIDGLLDYSRAGQEQGEHVAVNLAEVCVEVMADLSSAIRESNALIEIDELPLVRGRPQGLARLLQNLLSNAIKFRGDEIPHVRLWAERHGDHWQISLRDNGIGIAPEHVPRIFRLYQRLNSREKYAGNGLGLAICRKIVEEHGGEIWVDQASPGCIFRFTLPAVQPATVSVA